MKRITMVCVLLILAGSFVAAQSITSDLMQNDLEAFARKMRILDPKLEKMPYIAEYLLNTDKFEPAVLEFLIKNGADVNKPDSSSLYPLHIAIARHGRIAVELLLSNGADPKQEVSFEKLIKEYAFPWSKTEDEVYNITIHRASRISAAEFSIVYYDHEVYELFKDSIDWERSLNLSILSDEFDSFDKVFLFEFFLFNLYDTKGWGNQYYLDKSLVDSYRDFVSEAPARQITEAITYQKKKYDNLFHSIILDDSDFAIECLLNNAIVPDSYIVYAALFHSAKTLELFMDFHGYDKSQLYSCRSIDLPMLSYQHRELDLPLFLFPVLNGDIEGLRYFKDNGYELSKPFEFVVFNEKTDIPERKFIDLAILFDLYQLDKKVLASLEIWE